MLVMLQLRYCIESGLFPEVESARQLLEPLVYDFARSLQMTIFERL